MLALETFNFHDFLCTDVLSCRLTYSALPAYLDAVQHEDLRLFIEHDFVAGAYPPFRLSVEVDKCLLGTGTDLVSRIMWM